MLSFKYAIWSGPEEAGEGIRAVRLPGRAESEAVDNHVNMRCVQRRSRAPLATTFHFML
jgi:hypothetical protein